MKKIGQLISIHFAIIAIVASCTGGQNLDFHQGQEEQFGENVNGKDEDRFTMLMQRNSTRLMKAAANGHTDAVKALLKAGAYVDRQDNEGATALMYAAPNGHTAIVKVLLEAGANKDMRNDNGSTALMYAAQNDHENIVLLLKD